MLYRSTSNIRFSSLVTEIRKLEKKIKYMLSGPHCQQKKKKKERELGG